MSFRGRGSCSVPVGHLNCHLLCQRMWQSFPVPAWVCSDPPMEIRSLISVMMGSASRLYLAERLQCWFNCFQLLSLSEHNDDILYPFDPHWGWWVCSWARSCRFCRVCLDDFCYHLFHISYEYHHDRFIIEGKFPGNMDGCGHQSIWLRNWDH